MMTDQWAILELLGHRRLVGLVSECEVAGAGCLRIDVMDADGGFQATQYYFPAAVYGLTISTEAALRGEVERLKARPALTMLQYPVSDTPDIDEDDDEDDPCFEDADPAFEPPENVNDL